MTSPDPTEIRALRNSAGLTQTQFGALLHCALRTVQDWEGGQAKMPPGLWELARMKIKHRRLWEMGIADL